MANIIGTRRGDNRRGFSPTGAEAGVDQAVFDLIDRLSVDRPSGGQGVRFDPGYQVGTRRSGAQTGGCRPLREQIDRPRAAAVAVNAATPEVMIDSEPANTQAVRRSWQVVGLRYAAVDPGAWVKVLAVATLLVAGVFVALVVLADLPPGLAAHRISAPY